MPAASLESAQEFASSYDIPTTPFQRYTLRAYDELRAQEPGVGLHWSHVMLFDVNGELRFDAFVDAVRAVTDHHEVFRSVYVKREGGWVCKVKEGANTPVLSLQYDAPFAASRDALFRDLVAFGNDFDIGCGPLFRAAVFRTSDRELCAIAGHRLIGDLHTVRIMVKDLTLAYRQAALGESIALPPVSVPLREHTRRLEAELASPPSSRALALLDACVEAPGNRNIPWVSDKRLRRQTPEWGFHGLERGGELIDAAKKLGASVRDCVSVAIEAALAEWAGGPVAFGSIYHGRAVILTGKLSRPLRTSGMLEYFVPGLAEPLHGASATERVGKARAAREALRDTAVDMFRVFEYGLAATDSLDSWHRKIPVSINYIQLGLMDLSTDLPGPNLSYTNQYDQPFQEASALLAPKSRLPDFFVPTDIVVMENGSMIGVAVDPFAHLRPEGAKALEGAIEREVTNLLDSVG